MNSELIPLMVVIPLLAAVTANLLHGKDSILKAFVLSIALLLLCLPLVTTYGEHVFGGHHRDIYGSDIATGIEYTFSQHQQILTFVLALIGILVICVYVSSNDRLSGPYLGFFMIGMAATSAVMFADDLFNFYVFMEIAIISQTALAIATGTVRAAKTAVKYLIVGNICGNFLLFGIAMLLSATGSVNITDIARQIALGQVMSTEPLLVISAGFIVFAWMYAGGVFPFHNIKSELYASAMPHASAIMQTQTKFILVSLGIIILRIFAGVWGVRHMMLAASCGAMIFGVIMALKQDNYHKMLSYHAISQGGYVAAGLSIGTPFAIMAGIFHAINHVLYKSALFLGCEALERHRGTSDFSKLGGAIHTMPVIGGLVLCAKFAISGIPPFNGFQSKLMLMIAAFNEGMPEVSIIMLLVSVLTFISMMKAFHMAYLRPAQEGTVKVPAQSLGTYKMALMILVGLCIILGVFPDIAKDYLNYVSVLAGTSWS